MSGRCCTLAEVGCSQSHLALWRLGAERREPLMIFEDDVFFCDDIAAHLRRPLPLPDDLGIFYLGATRREGCRPFEGPGIYELSGCRTTHAYVISPRACDRLLDFAESLPNIASDDYTLLSHRNGSVRAHIYLPFWAVQTNDVSDIRVRKPLRYRFGNLFEGMLPRDASA